MDVAQRLRRGTFNPKVGQALWWPYYDRLVLDNATLETRLFTEKLGGLKNLADTNLPTGGEIPNGQKLTILAMEFWFWKAAGFTQAIYQNFLDMLHYTVLTFTITNKSPQLQLPMQMAFGMNLPQIIGGAAAGDQAMPRNVINAVYELGIPIVLAEQTPFSVDILHTVAPNAALDDSELHVALCGYIETL